MMGSGSISERPLIPLSGINDFNQNGRLEIGRYILNASRQAPGMYYCTAATVVALPGLSTLR